jgi:Raf kinase inhibitor-like YbhB/YbcL family protein
VKITHSVPGGILIFLSLLWLAGIWNSCGKEENNSSIQIFLLSSPAVESDSMLPRKFTCEGESINPPLVWENAPVETKCYVLLMDHIASETDIHWYWIVYNIPASVNSIPENNMSIGIHGTNSVNSFLGYAPPCSQGPGRKNYTITLFALSEFIPDDIQASSVNRERILEAIEGKIIAKAHLYVWYTKNN